MSKICLALGLLAGTCCGLQAQTTITVTTNPAQLTFTYQSGATVLPKAQKISMRASSGTPAFTVSTPATDFWLNVALNAGNLPATLSVTVNPNSLPVAQYLSAITVTVTGAAAPVVVPVTLNVTAAPSTLSLNPGTLTFSVPPNPATAQVVTLTTNGSPISFTATSGAAWLSASPAVGIVLPGQQVSLNVVADGTNLNPSATPYTAKITIVASGAAVTTKSQSITVGLTVNSQTPTIASIWPPSLPVGGPSQVITIRGSNFYSASLAAVQIGANTTALATTVISPTTLEAIVPSTMLTAVGNLNVIVENPQPGGNSAQFAEPVDNAPVILGVFSAASYASASVSPGELVTIFGTNIGPATAATMSITAGYIDTTLSNVTLTIDGQNAPLLYVSANQVTAQVPYEATQGAGKAVVLTNGTFPAANSP
ncbi:MAG TPA: IPT/TIG domain-containing protein [Bryobacteraceae bacterium]|nr:IPT/TIG domain-containing protein [Bryobacteraceae bacterium]